MKNISLYIFRSLMFVALSVAMISCEHKDLEQWPEDDVPTKAMVRVNVDWSQFTEDEDLTGMTVRVFDKNNQLVSEVLTNDLSYADFALEPGLYNVMVFNQSVSEFISLGFQNIDNYADAAICATAVRSNWYTRGDDDEVIAQEPAWFARAVGEFEVTQEMVNLYPYYTRVRGTKTKTRQSADPTAIVAELSPKNIVQTLEIKIDIENFQFLRSARASISDLAGDMNIVTGHSGDSHVTMLLEDWTFTKTKTVEMERGQIVSRKRFFGLPKDHKVQAEDNIFHLELLLEDGVSVLKYDFPVGNKMWESEDPELPLYVEIVIDLPEPLPDISLESGGVGINVGDWNTISIDVDV